MKENEDRQPVDEVAARQRGRWNMRDRKGWQTNELTAYGKRVMTALKRRGMTCAELAETIGATRSYLSVILRRGSGEVYGSKYYELIQREIGVRPPRVTEEQFIERISRTGHATAFNGR